MCTGFEIPLALAAAGGLASAVGGAVSSNEDTTNASNIANARNGVLVQQLNKNTTLGNDARGSFNGSMAQVQPAAFGTAQDAATTARENSITSNLPTITPNTFPGAADSSSLVKGAYASAMEDALAKAKTRATAQGQLGGYGDMFFNQGLKDADAGRQIGTDVNAAKANTALIPALQDFAQADVYKPNSGLGGILQGLGSAFGSFAGGLH